MAKPLGDFVIDAANLIADRAKGLLNDDGVDMGACHALAEQILEEYVVNVDCNICSKVGWSATSDPICEQCYVEKATTKTYNGLDLCDDCFEKHTKERRKQEYTTFDEYVAGTVPYATSEDIAKEKVQLGVEELCQDCGLVASEYISDCDMKLCQKCYDEHYSGSCNVCRNF